MNEEIPNPLIFDRNEARVAAEQYFSKQLDLLKDLANYGSNLIVRAFNSSPKNVSEIIVCGVLLKQIVTMLDSTEVLLRAGCGPVTQLPTRAALEASIAIDWILKSESEYRASCYLVGNYRAERTWTLRSIPGTPEHEEFSRQNSVQYRMTERVTANESIFRQRLEEIEVALSQPELCKINEVFSGQRKKSGRNHDPDWYVVAGAKSIQKMADNVGRSAEYNIFYSIGSNSVHGKSHKAHIAFQGTKVHFKPIRHLDGMDSLIGQMVAITLGTYRKILNAYRPEELSSFANTYQDSWQAPFRDIPKLAYEF